MHMAGLGFGQLPKEGLRLGRPPAPHLTGQDHQPGSAMFTRQFKVCALFPAAGSERAMEQW